MSRLSTRTVAIMLASMAAPASALADTAAPVPAPTLKVGDGWVYDQTLQKGQNGFAEERLDLAIDRLDGDTVLVGVKGDGAPGAFVDHVMGADWSKRRLVDGQDTVTTRPLTFPMTVGQSWTVDFVDTIRRGAQVSNHVHTTYTVADWEDVTVPAGTFHAVKVVAKGVDKAVLQVPSTAVAGTAVSAGQATGVTHSQRGGVGELTRRTYAEFYYVPQVKTWVKSVEEQYTPDDVMISRESQALVSYKLAP
jgi:hypothetical protein